MVDFFIERPVFASSIAIIMVLAGLIAWFSLPVERFPQITPPQVLVKSTYTGASAQVVADTVTTPLEAQINGVEGMSYISSVSANDGSSTITVTFDVGYDINIGAVDVQNRVSQATAQLPGIVTQTGITIQKQNPNFILAVNLYSPDRSIDPVTLSNFAYLQVVDALKRLPGVSDVTIFGERRYSMRIWLDPDKLAALGMTATDVQNAILDQNVQVAAGKFGEAPSPPGTTFQYQINTQGQLADARQFGDIVLRAGTTNDAVVHLRDVARTDLGAQQYTSSAAVNENPAVLLAVFQLPTANALDLDRRVKATMQTLARRFPKGMAWGITYDTTMFVSASMTEVMKTLGFALLLVLGVVYLFLQSWRTTLIPMIAIPVALVGTLAIMLVLRFSLNTVSLLGMVLAIGLVVDDAIVVVENVERQLESGLAPMAAAKQAMREVTGPIVATSAVLGAVFVPIAFLPGITGRLYNQFALTIAISVMLSAFNSLTLSPALCAVLLRHREKRRFVLFRAFNRGFDWARQRYAGSVRRLIGARWLALALFAGGLAVTYVLYATIPHAFLPVEDPGYFYVITQLPNGASLQRTEAVIDKTRAILRATPGVANVLSISGLNFVTRATASNAAAQFVILKPWDERGERQRVANLIAAVQPKLARIPEAVSLALNPPTISGLGTFGGFDFEIEDLTGRGSVALDDATRAFLAEARRQPELDARTLLTSFNTSTPQFDFRLDRDKAKLLGLNVNDVFRTMQIYLGSLFVNNVTLFGRNFEVVVQADSHARGSRNDLSRLYVRNAAGGMVPLATLGQLRSMVGPETVPRYNVYGAAEITGSAAPGYSSGQAIAAMERAARVLPADFGFDWTGITYQELKAGSVAGIVFALAIVFVFLFLAAQYESWTLPFTIILTVPLALFGALGLLWLRRMQVDIYAQIGFVLLIGLAAKNAILIVEFAKRRREAGLAIVDAVTEAARLRLRPILMTAFAFIFGAVPLMVATGAGAASRQSIGTTVVGGMLAATLLSLGFVPIFYAVIERLREAMRERVGRAHRIRPPPAE
ncbi:multidrug efflux RND transporter permease subunit [Burkholderia sp. Ac-20353]|uniref:efflux RND transporter permease subunit n=1 Tax=Burkholderia sp. Ac-20353 TaxID=2703894 RepID=UPI00197B2A63|nr:multidrug efflux RND transporter permease subunit [Burkholderia sp. Ac-20353]MBN3787196.1 multidrug efflux RND transporter permease subunit [Burkholderia sp. Ac-20353]